MTSMYILRTDRPTTDLASWKISNGHILATGHPIHFMFGSRVGFSGSADQMALLTVGENPKWQPAVGWPYFWNGSCHSFCVWFYGRVIGSADRISPLPVGPNPRRRPAAIFENVEWSHLCNSHFIFGSTVEFSGSVDRLSYIRLDQIQDRGRQPSCIILSGHISETVHPIEFVFGSRVKV